eukprot:scpid94718/ scgid1889/ 
MCYSIAPCTVLQDRICSDEDQYNFAIHPGQSTLENAVEMCGEYGMTVMRAKLARRFKDNECFKEELNKLQLAGIQHVWTERKNRNRHDEYDLQTHVTREAQGTLNAFICAAKVYTYQNGTLALG